MKARFLGVEVEYDPAIFHPDRYPKRKPGQRCGICDCYNGIRCTWGFRLKKDPDDWCFQFGSRGFADKLAMAVLENENS